MVGLIGPNNWLEKPLTISSSPEWKEITKSFPPTSKRSYALGKASFKFSSSEFTAILKAKNGNVAGFNLAFPLKPSQEW